MFGSWADGYEDSFVGTFAKNVSPERSEVMNFGVTALPTKRYYDNGNVAVGAELLGEALEMPKLHRSQEAEAGRQLLDHHEQGHRCQQRERAESLTSARETTYDFEHPIESNTEHKVAMRSVRRSA